MIVFWALMPCAQILIAHFAPFIYALRLRKRSNNNKSVEPLSLILWEASQGLDRNKLRIKLHTRLDMESCPENRDSPHNQCTSGKNYRHPPVVETANFPQRLRKHFRVMSVIARMTFKGKKKSLFAQNKSHFLANSAT